MIVINDIKTLLIVVLFSGARIAAALIVAPFFAPEIIPGLARNIILFNLTLILIPFTLSTIPIDTMGNAEFLIIIVKEVIIGFMIGAIISIAFQIAQSAGAFIDTQRGSSMGQLFDPMLGGSSTTLGALFTKIITILFFVGGGFMAFMTFVYQSYVFWPLFSFFPNFNTIELPKFILEAVDGLMKATVLIVAPISIVMFLTEFGLGMMNRFAPQLNVFSLSMPIKSGVAMFMIILYSSILFSLFKFQLAEGLHLLSLLKNII